MLTRHRVVERRVACPGFFWLVGTAALRVEITCHPSKLLKKTNMRKRDYYEILGVNRDAR